MFMKYQFKFVNYFSPGGKVKVLIVRKFKYSQRSEGK